MAGKGMIIELWMDTQAEEAAKFYTDIFKNSEIGPVRRRTVTDPSNQPVGSVLTADFVLNGQRFQALNGGPVFKPNEAVSIVLECEDQAELDYYWDKLSHAPESEQCGWCKDKYGFSWQIVPKNIDDLMYQEDEEKGKRAMEKLLEMHKIVISELEEA